MRSVGFALFYQRLDGALDSQRIEQRQAQSEERWIASLTILERKENRIGLGWSRQQGPRHHQAERWEGSLRREREAGA